MAVPELINSVEFDAAQRRCIFNLSHGDISSIDTELLVVSSHANSHAIPGGRVIKAINKRYGISFSELTPLLVKSGNFGTFTLKSDLSHTPFKRILVVRIPGADKSKEPVKLYEEALWTLFGSLAALEMRQEMFYSMAMPLLGGSRHYPLQDIISLIIGKSFQWLEFSKTMKEVNFCIFDDDKVEHWSEAMNVFLGRQAIVFASQNAVEAIRQEILSLVSLHMGKASVGERQVLKPLEKMLAQKSIYLQSLALNGRRVVEHVVELIYEKLSIKFSKNDLYEKIENLHHHHVAPWFISYFHILRASGNSEVHITHGAPYTPRALGDEDTLPLMTSLLRVLRFWKDELNSM